MRKRLISASLVALLAVTLMVGVTLATSLTPNPDLELSGQGLNFETAGVGLQNLDAGTESITINIGGPVEKALLYWAGADRPCPLDVDGSCIIPSSPDPYLDQLLLLDGTPVIGEVVGTEQQSSTRHFIGYRADVTSIVQAKGTGLQSFDIEDGDTASNLFVLFGAGLLVMYNDPADTGFYQIMVAEGMDIGFRPTNPPDAKVIEPITFIFDIDPSGDVRNATLGLFVGDAEPDHPDRIAISGNPDILNALDGDGGAPQWDSDTFPMIVPAGASSTVVEIFSEKNSDPDIGSNQPDSLVVETVILRIPIAPPVVPPGGDDDDDGDRDDDDDGDRDDDDDGDRDDDDDGDRDDDDDGDDDDDDDGDDDDDDDGDDDDDDD